jgi:hypothetical protein
VAFRNLGSPAFASIDHANGSEVPAEVNGRKQPCRSAANDEAIYHVECKPMCRSGSESAGLTEKEVAFFVNVDFVNHVALVAGVEEAAGRRSSAHVII